MKTKRIVFYVGLSALILILFRGFVETKLNFNCYSVNEYGHTTNYCDIFVFSIAPLLLFIPFAGILYFFRDQVFNSWWGFARWFTPVIIVTTLLLETGIMGEGGSWGIASGLGEFMILVPLYAIFILVSLIRIIWTCIKTRKN